MVAWSLLATIVESIELAADADNDLLFLAWDNPLFSGSLVDYATICPTVFSALVLAAYAMCSGPSTFNLLVCASRGVIRGISGSPVWHALVKGDLLGLVLLALGTTFDMTLSLIRPQWADRIYADLAIHRDVPVVVAILLPSALVVGCFIVAPSLLAYGSGMFGVFMDNTGMQSPGCYNLGYPGVPFPYSGQREVAFRRLFCEGELAGFELADWWKEFVETQLYNWELFQLVAFTTVLAVVAIVFIAEWAFIEIQRDSASVTWLDTLISAPATDNGDTVANKVGTPVESRPSGTHHDADQTIVSTASSSSSTTTTTTTKDAATETDADNSLAVMNQMESRIRDLECVNSTTASRLQAETYDLAYELMTKNQSLLTTQEECADLKSLLAQQRELHQTQEARMTSLQQQNAALVSSNDALQAQVNAQSLELQQAAQQLVAAPVVTPVKAPVVTTPVQELEAPVVATSVMMVDSRPPPAHYHHHHYHHGALRSDKRQAALLRRQLQQARRQRRNLIAGNSKCREQLSAQERAVDDATMALKAQTEAVCRLTERNEVQLRTIAALEMENNERDAEVVDFEKQHDAYVADLKQRLSDQTAMEKLRSQVEAAAKKEKDHNSNDEKKDSELKLVESMYTAFLEERDEDIVKKDEDIQRKDNEIQKLTESKDVLSQELEQSKQELEQSKQKLEQTTKDYNVQRAQVLKNANTIEKLRRRVQQEGQAVPGGQPIPRGAPQPTKEEPHN
ncbi:hypothetical protein MGYG_09203 [Nannizzia gypsea CBS 118893]|uniref:Uncharacterized protein n=1 Tax=Arthroderma gypseum (strain ATCC MYA-4604 / CBS 118893) TaxID=535722 RepID=E4V6R0_ARTGP|nr:hypothetical protein MGYG_09203 [Nannizzia gypsea CBS 118893]EFQ96776.1 hypothetical protein MGYG_09203 [Nannizzia gypsea CBS 118893]